MTEQNRAEMNRFSQTNTPFIALLSYDEPKKDIVYEISEAKKRGLKFKFDAKFKGKISYKLKKFPLKFKIYHKAFKKVQDAMKNGDCELLNLCFPTPFKNDLKLKEIYRYSSAPLKIMLKNNFVCFTPEIFVEIENGVIKTFPMKGTIDAKIKNAKEKLLNDKKEFDEQMMVTKLMQNDLSAVASSVEIKKFRYFSEIKTRKGKILQTSSEICGILNEHYLQNFGDLFEKILPAGSISGAPKDKTCEIIRKNELVKRGFYSGVFVYFDGKILRSFVMIRFVQKISKNKFRFFSGGGITLKSKAKKEFDELNKKAYFTF